MNKTNIRKTIICIAAAFAAISCHLDDTLYYNNLTMGNVVEGRFVSDQGNTFNVVEQIGSENLAIEKRVMLLCDVLNATKGQSNEYDVRLRTFSRVLTKEPVAIENAAEGDIAAQDPVHIDQLWFAGGYINMVIKTHSQPNSEVKHLINLVYSKGENGEYILNLRHNAFGEVINKTEPQLVLTGGAYVSFPISEIIKEDKAKIVLNWKWYETNDFSFNYEKEKDYSFEYEWERKGFIQKK